MTLRHTLLILGSVTAAFSAALGMAACGMAGPTAPTAVSASPAQSLEGPGMLATRKDLTVGICHRQNNGSYDLIDVAVANEPEHLAHGDTHPGDGTADFTMEFAGNCGLTAVKPGGGSGSGSLGSGSSGSLDPI